MEKLGLKDRMHFSRGHPACALESGGIEMATSEKSNSRLQKYLAGPPDLWLS
ncbi:MAG: hypothetical protein PHY78_11940 [Desulfobacterales bacterium]|nr:hypothetical protein [Desulfobacterales bacterium]MDD4394138.1 hypothetical protein [Desulfobacterales bacterium]